MNENEEKLNEEQEPIPQYKAPDGDEQSGDINWEAKCKELEDKYIRAYADLDNTKKRLEKEKYQAIDYTNEKFAKDMLPVVDALELAQAHIKDGSDIEKIKEGISLTLDSLFKVFEKHGIKQIAHEAGFDPNFHEAVMQTPSDAHDDGAIVAILQKGYLLKERILRPSLVSVCQK